MDEMQESMYVVTFDQQISTNRNAEKS